MKTFAVRADRSDSRDVRRSFVTEGLEAGFTAFIIRKEDTDLRNLGRFEPVFTDNGAFPDGISLMEIHGPSDMEKTVSRAGKDRIVILSMRDQRVTPLENIIAAFGGTGTEVLVSVDSEEQAKLSLTAMEKGADGVVIDIDDPAGLRGFKDLCTPSEHADLTEVTVTSVRNVEMGDRVCVDTCSVMTPGEGMLVGSYSDCLFLVQSESEENGYVATRPFRVNAGAVFGYTRVPGGRTAYLSELGSGSTVLICDRSGGTRAASVGRCKNELRPLMMVEAEHGGRTYSVILQNAETVRLVTADGSVPVSSLGPGDRVLAELSEGGRHFGMPVEETVTER